MIAVMSVIAVQLLGDLSASAGETSGDLTAGPGGGVELKLDVLAI
jgi:hypothetical protein